MPPRSRGGRWPSASDPQTSAKPPLIFGGSSAGPASVTAPRRRVEGASQAEPPRPRAAPLPLCGEGRADEGHLQVWNIADSPGTHRGPRGRQEPRNGVHTLPRRAFQGAPLQRLGLEPGPSDCLAKRGPLPPGAPVGRRERGRYDSHAPRYTLAAECRPRGATPLEAPINGLYGAADGREMPPSNENITQPTGPQRKHVTLTHGESSSLRGQAR